MARVSTPADTPADSAPPAAPPPRAAGLLVGDELLSGKIRDSNGYFLAQSLRRRGIALTEIRTVSDDPRDIGHALLALAESADFVFTSGGVGPTHDDRTLSAIAAATGRPLVRHAEMAAQLRESYGDKLNDAALSMADLPEGTAAVFDTRTAAGKGWPVLRLDLPQSRVYILPGVPSLFRAKIEQLEALPDELPMRGGWHLAEVHTSLEESRLAPLLDAVLERFAEVQIGSYPRWTRADDGRVSQDVRVTLEGPATLEARVREARQALVESLPDGALIPAAAPL